VTHAAPVSSQTGRQTKNVIVLGGPIRWFKPGQTTPPIFFAEGVQGRLSRSGAWLAYTSSADVGRPEIYVAAFS
jgi:hypothetical protein